MLNVNLTSRLSTLIIGLLIYFVPFFTYLTPENLTQLTGSDVLEIFLALTVLLILVFIISFGAEKLIKRFFKKNIILFPLFCFVFYLNFLYTPFFYLLQEFLFTQFNLMASIGIPIFIIFEFFCFGIIAFGAKYNVFSLRMIFIFSILTLLSSIVPLVGYIVENITNKPIVSYEFNSDFTVQDDFQIKRNVYYIILDAMAGIEALEPFNIATKNDLIDKLSNTELRYIDKSISSYSGSIHSLTSILLLDYHQTPDSLPRSDLSFLYPGIIYNMGDSVPLFAHLKKVNSSFYWAPGENFDCVPFPKWTCINKQNNLFWSGLPGLSLNLWNFSLTTPLSKILKRFSKNIRSQDTIGPFLEYIDKNGVPEAPFFAFIHHNIPHGPHEVTSECEPANYYNQSFEGYKASYQCALKMIQIFMQKINMLDPEAVVIFQGDHGLRKFLNLNLSEDEKYLFTGSIFNAIKAPEICFNKYGLPRTTVNSIRFAINCAYGFKLPYKKNIHYSKNGQGGLTERKLYE